MIRNTIRMTSLGICAAGVAFVAAACTEPGYRTAVHSEQQGRVEVTRIPVATPPPLPPSPPAEPVRPAIPSDKDLADIESIWPHLNPADRQRVADMARRLAGQPQ